jgi:hypothetical protein
MSQNNQPSLQAKPAIMTLTLEITRAATGKTETVELVCTPMADDPQPQYTEQPKEQ